MVHVLRKDWLTKSLQQNKFLFFWIRYWTVRLLILHISVLFLHLQFRIFKISYHFLTVRHIAHKRSSKSGPIRPTNDTTNSRTDAQRLSFTI